MENAVSLIDFDADPEPPPAAAVPQAQQTSATQPSAHPATSGSDNNWASFDVAPEAKVSQVPSNANSLQSVLSQLTVSASGAPGGVGSHTTAPNGNVTMLPIAGGSAVAPVGNTAGLPFAAGASVSVPIQSLSMLPPGASANAPGLTQMLPVNGGNPAVKIQGSGQWPNMQHQQPSFFPASGSQSTAQQYAPSVDVASSNQVG